MIESGVVIVHMRLDKVVASILVKIDLSFAEFVAKDGSSVVQLDKALYGCVEVAHLWYLMLREKLEAYGFEANPVEPCVFNKLNAARRSSADIPDDAARGRPPDNMYKRDRDRLVLCIPAHTVPGHHSTQRQNTKLPGNDIRLP